MSSEQEPSHPSSKKFALFQTANEIVEPLLSDGFGFTLSAIRELMTNIDETMDIHNNEVKNFIVKTYNDRIRFCPSKIKNLSLSHVILR